MGQQIAKKIEIIVLLKKTEYLFFHFVHRHHGAKLNQSKEGRRFGWRESRKKQRSAALDFEARSETIISSFSAVCTMFGDKAYDLIRELERTGPDTLPLYNVSHNVYNLTV